MADLDTPSARGVTQPTVRRDLGLETNVSKQPETSAGKPGIETNVSPAPKVMSADEALAEPELEQVERDRLVDEIVEHRRVAHLRQYPISLRLYLPVLALL
jgi:hypothetical protein